MPNVNRIPNRPQTDDTYDTVTHTGDVVEVDVHHGPSTAAVWVESVTGPDGDRDSYVADLDAQDLDDLIANLTAARYRLREVTHKPLRP